TPISSFSLSTAPAPTSLYTLSLHDALPISPERSAHALRHRIAKVPDESVHARLRQKRFRIAHPLHLNWHVVGICLVQDVIARESPHQVSFGVEDFQLNRR